MERILGVDYGTRRVGIAVSDTLQTVATGREILNVTTPKDAVRQVAQYAEQESAEKVVVGLPLHLDGGAGELAVQVNKFVEALRRVVKCEVVTWDERLTSKQAERVLIDAGTRRDKRRKVLDKMAAQLMLQSYLDAQAGPIIPPPEW